MQKKYLIAILFVSLMAIFSFACNQGDNNAEEDDSDTLEETEQIEKPVEDSPAICLWSSVTLRETPQLKGKYKNIIYLGEKASYLGETVSDSADKKNPREFIKIKLTDGTQGWVQANMMAINAKSYALREKTKLYKRPDILSVGKDEFDKMQFVVVTEEQEDWVKVKGKKKTDGWFKEGWIKADRLSSSEIDVTVSILAERALLKADDDKRKEALNEILSNPDFSSSIFMNDIRAMVEAYNEPQESEEYYEGD
jgi:hypothetical protein